MTEKQVGKLKYLQMLNTHTKRAEPKPEAKGMTPTHLCRPT